MKTDYKLKLPNEQNDFNRFIAHAQAYKAEDIEIAVRAVKNMLIEQMAFLPLQPCVYLNILSSDEVDAYIVFDAPHNDVCLKIVSHGFNGYTAYVLEGTENRARISVGEVNPESFAAYASKPLKLLLLFLVNDVMIFLKQQQGKWIEVPKLIQTVKEQVLTAKQAMGEKSDDGHDTDERNDQEGTAQVSGNDE